MCKQCKWRKIEELKIYNPYGLGQVGTDLIYQCKVCERLLRIKSKGTA